MFGSRALWIYRFFFILLFLSTGIGKLLDNRGFAEVIKTYHLVPDIITLPLGLSVSLFELVLAIMIVTGIQLKWAAIFSVFSHVGYVILAATSLLRGLNLQNCGCFGVFWARPLTISTVIEDLILLALSVLFYVSVSKNSLGESSHNDKK